MLYLHYANAGWFRSNIRLDRLLHGLPPSMHHRARRYRSEAAAYNFVLGRRLLQEGLRRLEMKTRLDQLTIDETGKPLLPGIYFNISHSDDLVVCGLTKTGAIGIDVEHLKDIELKNFQAFFTPEEWRNILEAPTPLLLFYRYWTRKESILKALGLTLSDLHRIAIDASENRISWKGKRWHLRELNEWEGYQGAVCSEEPIQQIERYKYNPGKP